jgi:hypothetical protein
VLKTSTVGKMAEHDQILVLAPHGMIPNQVHNAVGMECIMYYKSSLKNSEKIEIHETILSILLY